MATVTPMEKFLSSFRYQKYRVTITREVHLLMLMLRRSNAKRTMYVRIIVRKLRKRSVMIQAVRTDSRLAGARVARPRNSFVASIAASLFSEFPRRDDE